MITESAHNDAFEGSQKQLQKNIENQAESENQEVFLNEDSKDQDYADSNSKTREENKRKSRN